MLTLHRMVISTDGKIEESKRVECDKTDEGFIWCKDTIEHSKIDSVKVSEKDEIFEFTMYSERTDTEAKTFLIRYAEHYIRSFAKRITNLLNSFDIEYTAEDYKYEISKFSGTVEYKIPLSYCRELFVEHGLSRRDTIKLSFTDLEQYAFAYLFLVEIPLFDGEINEQMVRYAQLLLKCKIVDI